MTMRSSLVCKAATALALVAASALSCNSGFPTQHANSLLELKLTGGTPGSATALIPLNFTDPDTYTFDVTALDGEGNIDTSFNGYVRLSSHPGSVSTLTGNNTEGRNVLLKNGVAKSVGVEILGAYGNTHIWAEDIGYAPADPIPEGGAPNPQCSDGIDNNNNGLIDFPADPGCAYANDNSEDGGSFSTGISEIIFYASPRVADVRGISSGGSTTSFPNEQVDLDVGYRSSIKCKDGSSPPCYDFSVIVTRIAAGGFYVADISDKRGFNNVYAYNFSAPPNMAVCDRLNSFGGTASDFYGFTEINYPTWSLDEWRGPTERPCGVPEAVQLTIDELPVVSTASNTLFSLEAGIVRVESDAASGIDLHVGSHFGSAKPTSPDFVPTDTASDCDLNDDGKVDFTAGTDEGTCSSNCDSDPECVEYSNYVKESQFRLVLAKTDSSGNVTYGTIYGDASAASGSAVDTTQTPQAQLSFDPETYKGKTIPYFTGTLEYFSGGTQFTIQARCPDDIVLTGQPLASDVACVAIRTASEYTQ
jgi:hypothetical protein